jgi:hypothetical protein
MNVIDLFAAIILSTIGCCGFAFPSTATREGWPVNLHLASGLGQVMTAALAVAGIAFAAYHGGLAVALTVFFASSLMTYAALRYMCWHAQRAVLVGELILVIWGAYVGTHWLLHASQAVGENNQSFTTLPRIKANVLRGLT